MVSCGASADSYDLSYVEHRHDGDRTLLPRKITSVRLRAGQSEAALKVAEEGLRWVSGADAGADLGATLPLERVRAAQAGLLADMNQVADALYGREA